MKQRKMFWVCGPLTAIALTLGASSAQADIVFGNVNPAPLLVLLGTGLLGFGLLQARLGRPGS